MSKMKPRVATALKDAQHQEHLKNHVVTTALLYYLPMVSVLSWYGHFHESTENVFGDGQF